MILTDIRSILILLFSLILSQGSAALSIADEGKKLFAKQCAACHGDNGTGGSALALNKEGLLVTVDEEYLSNSIRFGRPLSGCPSFEKKISQNEIDSLVAFIKGWQKGENLTAPDYTVEPESSDRGKELFAICGACHGLKAEGAMGPPLLDPGLLRSISDGILRKTIMYGRPGTPMKGFTKGYGLIPLPMEDIDVIISYMRYKQRELTEQ